MTRVPLKIRWKFLLTMIVIAAAPLLLSAWLDMRSIARLGEQLAQQSGQAINEQTRANLQQAAEQFTRIIGREAQTIELIVRLQARAVELQLKNAYGNPQYLSEHVPLWANDFQGGNETPGYSRIGENGEFAPLAVDFTRQSFYAVPQADPRSFGDDVRGLIGLNAFYQDVKQHHSDLIYWQYTVLESGILATFPGHGHYPEDFDPRKRSWYEQQRATPGLLWSPAHTDAATGIAMLNVTMPVARPDGGFHGITGIDVRVAELLRSLRLPLELGDNARVVLSILVNDDNTGDNEVFIVAEHSKTKRAQDWQTAPTAERLKLDDDAHSATLAEDIRTNEAGFFQTRWQDRDYFCVYHPIGLNRSTLLLFIPVDELLDPAMRSAEYALSSTKRHIDSLLPFAAILIVAVIFIAFIGSRRFVEPIKQLVHAFTEVGEGNFDVRVDVRSGDELQQLGEAFNKMIPDLEAHTKVREELSVARAVQQRLLPGNSQNFEGLSVAGRTLYADQTGGDYYDFIALPNHTPAKLAIVLGDVSGHGVASALMMATVRALLHGSARTITSPAALLQHVNENLVNDVHAGQFMTLFYLLVDTSTGQITWADAGHDPAIRYNFASDEFSELTGHDIPLGVDHAWKYERDLHAVLDPDDIVLLGTDGIWETKSPNGEAFGKQRLREIIYGAEGESVESICDRVLEAVKDFRGDQHQHDDITVVVFRIDPDANVQV